MGDGTAVALWFGASGFEVLEVGLDGIEVTVAVQTTATTVGCSSCGTRAVAKDRRWVTLRDAPTGGRPVRVRWRKRIWACPDPDCGVRTWTEAAELAEPRRLLTARAAVWATDQVAAIQATPASLSRDFGVAWSTVWSAVQRVGRQRIDDPARVGPTAMVGFDETVMQPAHRRRRRRLVTAVVDVAVVVASGGPFRPSARTPLPGAQLGPGWRPCPPSGWRPSRSCRSTPTRATAAR